MARLYRLRLWLVLALIVVLIAVVALWLRSTSLGDARSPLPTPPVSGMETRPADAVSGVSPLSTPTPVASAASASAPTSPSSWAGGGLVLLWVALGIVVALGIAFIILRWHRHVA